MKGVTKIMRGSGCEEILVAAGACPGTVKKVLGNVIITKQYICLAV
jgi:hypothetical protein